MADAVAQATGLPRRAVDRATMLRGDARVVAEVVLREGEAGLERVRAGGRPAGRADARVAAASLEEAMEKLGGARRRSTGSSTARGSRSIVMATRC